MGEAMQHVQSISLPGSPTTRVVIRSFDDSFVYCLILAVLTLNLFNLCLTYLCFACCLCACGFMGSVSL